jgi:hypothetical protein
LVSPPLELHNVEKKNREAQHAWNKKIKPHMLKVQPIGVKGVGYLALSSELVATPMYPTPPNALTTMQTANETAEPIARIVGFTGVVFIGKKMEGELQE